MKLNEVTGRKAGDLKQVQDYSSGSLYVAHERLTSLEGCPEKISEWFFCSDNLLTSLEGGPTYIGGNFNCSNNQLKSLKGCPEKINGWFKCSTNQLTSFEYFPKYIDSYCEISDNEFTSFKDIDKHIEYIGTEISAIRMDITSGYSDLFGIDGLQRIYVDNDNQEIQDITNKYLPSKDLIEFQDEMIKSGYESYL